MRNELLIMIKHIFNWKRRIFFLASALIMACIFALGTPIGVAIASNDKNEGVLVDKYTFGSDKSIYHVQLGYDVTFIEDGSFSKLVNLQTIDVDSKNPYYMSYGGCLYNKDGTELLCIPQNTSSVPILYSVKKHSEHALDGISKARKDKLEEAIKNGFTTKTKGSVEVGTFSGTNNSGNSISTDPKNSTDKSDYIDLDNWDYSKGSSFYDSNSSAQIAKSLTPDSSAFQQYVYTGSDGKVTFKYTGSGYSTIVVPEGVTKIAGFAEDPWTFNDEITCVYLPSTLRTMSVSNMYCQEEFGWDNNGYNVLHQCRNLQNVYGSSSSYSGNGSSVTRPGGITVWSSGTKTPYDSAVYNN